MTPRLGSSTAATAGRTWRQHRAAACGTALILAVASALAGGFGAVVERLTIEDTATCASQAADSSINPVPWAAANGYGPSRTGTTSSFGHAVDRPYDEPAVATTEIGGAPGRSDDAPTGRGMPGVTCEITSTSVGFGGALGYRTSLGDYAAPRELQLFGT